MRAPRFWWRQGASPGSVLMTPVGAVVGAIAGRRIGAPARRRLNIPVVCIGNPTVGGAGKTPVAIAVAHLLARNGQRPVFLTRGYRGRLAGPVEVKSTHCASDVGDEPLLLARYFPTVVAQDRAAGGALAATLGNVVVMDDGFQNPGLAKNFSVLVIDAAVGLGNGCVTPAGPMRAPFDAQIPHADAVLLTHVAGDDATRCTLPALNVPCHTVVLRPKAPRNLAGVDVLAFAGIGRPEKFFRSLEGLGADVRVRYAFADHALYDEDLASRLIGEAIARGLTLATTAKDAVRLRAGGPVGRKLTTRAVILDIDAELPPAFADAVLAACGATGRGPNGARGRGVSGMDPALQDVRRWRVR
ncbi:tetraacyldisaccharide 4'-kinase [Acuticoccus sp. MNP-M23]|uniref:tetraacyldisaccharide 4'-kinase n=1 Tax=Acuticoccus sp. MNP-M23 TaxID=3072793 RepID=UPI002815DBE7|nr:tetraacyldisaccharide 4'-kinase [Acuticoccus sp. MNP-M23]WMS44738.1 tetraacyldisaccharide 4'-kinase [Acuticoccus sp. MNP-M23]